METKTAQQVHSQLYLEVTEAIADGNTTFNRTVAAQYFTSHPLWSDQHVKLQERILSLANSKTNWGKNIYIQEVHVMYTRFFLGLS